MSGAVTTTMRKPGWLEGLMGETFFGSCGSHEDRRKNEKNIFCLRCCLSVCPHCLPSHRSHPLLQVRRYVYLNVVRLGDLEKLIDCSFIQPYTINGAKVIFLTQRAQTRSCKGSSHFCFNCDRILQDPFHFCSLTCKVNHLFYQVGGNLSSFLRKFDESEFTITQFEGLRMDGFVYEDGEFTSKSILENTSTARCKQGSSSSSECEVAAAANPDGLHMNSKRSRKKREASGDSFQGWCCPSETATEGREPPIGLLSLEGHCLADINLHCFRAQQVVGRKSC